MSELLDAFDDAGVDVETKQFLIEALHHAEEAQWSDVLEPFVNLGSAQPGVPCLGGWRMLEKWGFIPSVRV